MGIYLPKKAYITRVVVNLAPLMYVISATEYLSFVVICILVGSMHNY